MAKNKEWSPDGYIKAHLRKIWRWSPQRRECLKSTNCRMCQKRSKELFADHIEPVVDPLKGFQGWEVYITRLFSGKLQPLCKSCHATKTKEEGKVRRAVKKAKNV